MHNEDEDSWERTLVPALLCDLTQLSPDRLRITVQEAPKAFGMYSAVALSGVDPHDNDLLDFIQALLRELRAALLRDYPEAALGQSDDSPSGGDITTTVDETEWTADAYYGQKWQVWAEVDPPWAADFIMQELADESWQLVTSVEGEARVIEAIRADEPGFRLRVAPHRNNTLVDGVFLAHDGYTYHDFVLLYGLVVRWSGAKVLRGPFVPEAEREPEATAEPETRAEPGVASQAASEPREAPRVPSRGADRRRWRATWRAIEKEVEKGRSTKWIAEWLAKTHGGLACSPDTLADIIRAGEAGLLDG